MGLINSSVKTVSLFYWFSIHFWGEQPCATHDWEPREIPNTSASGCNNIHSVLELMCELLQSCQDKALCASRRFINTRLIQQVVGRRSSNSIIWPSAGDKTVSAAYQQRQLQKKSLAIRSEGFCGEIPSQRFIDSCLRAA